MCCTPTLLPLSARRSTTTSNVSAELLRRDLSVAELRVGGERIAGQMRAQPTQPAEILLVEDNPGDVRLIEESLRESDRRVNLNVTRDGVEALAFLRRQGEYANAPRPDLILLDLNLPRKDGRETLAEIKSEEPLKRIPVLILTTSSDEKDVTAAYAMRANCYIIKPIDLENFFQVVGGIKRFWLTIVRLPPG